MKPQVDRSLYFSADYLSPGRFASYGYQLSEILNLTPESVLEIGIGNGIVSHFLREAGINVTTLDLDVSLNPSVAGSVAHLPFGDESFDVVACFEVLEHMPFGQSHRALHEIRRVCRRHALVSLPDCGRYVPLYLPKIGRRRFLIRLPSFRRQDVGFDGEHYWELGRKGYPLRRITGTMTDAGFTVQSVLHPWENPYHRFFRLRKGCEVG